MKPLLLASIAVFSLCTSAPAFAGRQPCDRGAGGVAYCVGEKFRCNDGRISRSKRICDPDVYGTGRKTGNSISEKAKRPSPKKGKE
jgi:hypothetical protein